MNQERDKFLTEYLGECWHEFDTRFIAFTICKKCSGKDVYKKDFSTWQGFGWLWEKCQEQEWWVNFIRWFERQVNKGIDGRICTNTLWYLELAHPDRFADAVYEYLKEQS